MVEHDCRCVNCRYFARLGWDGKGECRRRPPADYVVIDLNRAWFPRVLGGDWCGEFMPVSAKRSKGKRK